MGTLSSLRAAECWDRERHVDPPARREDPTCRDLVVDWESFLPAERALLVRRRLVVVVDTGDPCCREYFLG